MGWVELTVGSSLRSSKGLSAAWIGESLGLDSELDTYCKSFGFPVSSGIWYEEIRIGILSGEIMCSMRGDPRGETMGYLSVQ
jgi:hypothetical protein